MGNVTIGQLGAALGLLCGIAASVEFMYSRLRKWLAELIKNELQPLQSAQEEGRRALLEIDIAQSKNFLTRCFDDLESGRELTEKTKLRIYEVFDHYTNDLNQNSYIHDEFERLKKGGKL